MKNLSGASLLHVLPATRRSSSKLPLPTGDRAGGGPGEATARSLARRRGGAGQAALFEGEP